MQSIVPFHKSQRIFHLKILFYRRILSDHEGTSIHNYFWTKMTFIDHVKQRRHFMFLLLRTREGYMPTITKSGLIAAGEIPFKHAWARLPLIEIDRDSAIINLAYLFAGLVTIAQSRLVHRILQGVEHTDPTKWSTLTQRNGAIHTLPLETNS